jgi:hypothetical protein
MVMQNSGIKAAILYYCQPMSELLNFNHQTRELGVRAVILIGVRCLAAFFCSRSFGLRGG